MRFALLAALLPSLLLAGFAGCLEEELALLTAKDARERSDGEADDWADDATLLGATGLEAGPVARERFAQVAAPQQRPGSPQPDQASGQRDMLAAVAGTEDEAIGDGRAPVWVLTYGSEAEDSTLHVVVTSHGVSSISEGAGEERAGFGSLGGQPVTEWRLDSDEGAEVARLDEQYSHAVSDPGAVAFTLLLEGKDGPIWIFSAEVETMGQDGGSGTMVALSAMDGTVIEPDELVGQVFGFILQESGSSSGTTVAGAGFSFFSDFDVQLEGHGTLAVLVSVSPPPVLPMTMVVTDPAGNESTATIGAGTGLAAQQSIVLDVVPSGGYEVRVSTDLAILADWEISWCTDGVALLPPAPACDLVPSSEADSLDSLWETLSPLRRWASA